MEREDEIAGLGNSFTAKFWEYDSRTGRRWNQDPVDMFSLSRYATFADNPISYTDPLGDEIQIEGLTDYFILGSGEFAPNLAMEEQTIEDFSTFESYGETVTLEQRETEFNKITNSRNQLKTAVIGLIDDWKLLSGYELIYDSNGCMEKVGILDDENYSQTAREFIDYMLDSEETLVFTVISNSRTEAGLGSDYANIDPIQIEYFLNNTSGVNNKTMGYGLNGLHEASHTMFGIKAEELLGVPEDKREGFLDDDTKDFFRDAFTFINKIRAEFDALGIDNVPEFGQRLRYKPQIFNEFSIIRFKTKDGLGNVYTGDD